MQLLLFLSALLAGLTGAITGDRYARVAQQGSEAPITRTAEIAVAAVANVAAARAEVRPVADIAISHAGFAIHDAPAPRPARLTSERRLE